MSLGDESKPHEIRDDPSGESEKDALKPRTSEEIEPVKGGSPDASEKDTGDIERKADVALHTLDAGNDADDPYKTTFDKEGNPIINSGHDVARHLMSDRDDGDPALTLRGFILGSSLAVLANMLSALFSAKPTYVGFGTLFEMLILLVSLDCAQTCNVKHTLKTFTAGHNRSLAICGPNSSPSLLGSKAGPASSGESSSQGRGMIAPL